MVGKSQQRGCGCGAASHITSTDRMQGDECPCSTPFLISLQSGTQTHGTVPPALGRSSHVKEPSQHSPSQCAWSLACWESPEPVKLIVNTNHAICVCSYLILLSNSANVILAQWADRICILPNFHIFPYCHNLRTHGVPFYYPYIQNIPSFVVLG